MCSMQFTPLPLPRLPPQQSLNPVKVSIYTPLAIIIYTGLKPCSASFRDFVLSILKNSAQEPCDHPPDLLVLTRVCEVRQWSYGKELHYDSEIVSATALAAPQAFPQAPAETFGEP